MKQYGYLVTARASRWHIAFPGDDGREFYATQSAAATARSAWVAKEEKAGKRALEEAADTSAKNRAQFVADSQVEIVSVSNPKLFQADYRKPTVKFPDGSERQFEEGVPAAEIEAHIEATALEKHPEPNPDDAKFAVSPPEIETARVWEAKLILDGEQRELPDIYTWDHYFPMESVASTLNALAREGWSVVHVSEDKGLYSSEIASNMAAPLLARYLLAREEP